jgi:hypothetical protein
LISRSQACVAVRLRPSSTKRQGVNEIIDAAGAHIWSKTATPPSGADIIRTPAATVNARRFSPKKCHD